MTLSDLAPAIGGAVFTALMWSYAHYLKRRYLADRAADKRSDR